MPRVLDAAPPPTSLPSLSPGEGQAMARAGTEQAVSNLPGASVASAVRDSQRIGMDIMPALRAGDYKGAASAFIGSTAAALGAIPGVHMLPGFAGVIAAYHGSPHLFDEFKSSAIGTGEGAQAYGHGLYFAESQDVAAGYKHNLTRTKGEWEWQGQPLRESRDWYSAIDATEKDNWRVAKILDQAGKTGIDSAREAYSARNYSSPEWDEARKQFEGGINFKPSEGALYSVKLDVNHDDLLDWDKPLSEQSPGVRAAVGLDAAPAPPSAEEVNAAIAGAKQQGTPLSQSPEYQALQERAAAAKKGGFDALGILPTNTGAKAAEVTGAHLYSGLTQKFGGDPAAASAALHAAGIPGIRYLDAGSRGTPEELHYIVSDKAGYRSTGYADRAKIEQRLPADREDMPDARIETVRTPATRNVVMFDPSLVRIESVNGQPVPTAAEKASDGLSILAHPEAWGAK